MDGYRCIQAMKKNKKKRRTTRSTVTPMYGDFRSSKLETVAGSARRIFLCEGVVQGRIRSEESARQCEISKKAKKRLKSLILNGGAFGRAHLFVHCDYSGTVQTTDYITSQTDIIMHITTTASLAHLRPRNRSQATDPLQPRPLQR